MKCWLNKKPSEECSQVDGKDEKKFDEGNKTGNIHKIVIFASLMIFGSVMSFGSLRRTVF